MSRILAVYTIGVALLLVGLPIIAPRTGPLALANILSAHLALAGLVFTPIAIKRRSAPGLRSALLVLAGAATIRFGGEWFSVPPNIDSADRPLRTATWNLELGARAGEGAVQGLGELDVDVVALQELGPDHVRAMNSSLDLSNRFPARELHPDDGVLGIGLLSRYPIVKASYTTEPSTIEAVLDVDGRAVTVITAHPLPGSIGRLGPLPLTFDARNRDVELLRVKNLAGYATDRGETVIVLGDFNVAPTEPGYADLVEGLRDAHVEVGEGPGWTWRPSSLEWTGLGFLRIDLALSGRGAQPLAVAERCGLPGDHCQLQATFRLVPPSAEPVFLLLPGQAGEVAIRPLPVEVIDPSGLLRGANAALEPFVGEGVRGVPGSPQRVRVTWIGGACDRNATMRLGGDRAAVLVSVETFQSAGSCPAVGVFRTVELLFAEVIDPAAITVATN